MTARRRHTARRTAVGAAPAVRRADRRRRTGRAAGPRAGDVVVERERPGRPVRYLVRQAGGRSQVACNCRESALAFATAFARQHQVHVWIDDDFHVGRGSGGSHGRMTR